MYVIAVYKTPVKYSLFKHLFNDLGFKRPIFYTYFKLSMLALFMFRCGHQKECDKDEPNGSPEVISKVPKCKLVEPIQHFVYRVFTTNFKLKMMRTQNSSQKIWFVIILVILDFYV